MKSPLVLMDTNNMNSRDNAQHNIHTFLLFFIPTMLCICLVIVTMFLWIYTKQYIDKQTAVKFANDSAVLKGAVNTRLSIYLTSMYGTRALFAGSTSVTRNEFATYVKSSNIQGRFPGITGISFIQHVTQQNKEAFTNAVRNDTSFDTAGYPNFSIKPPGNRPDYYVLNYSPAATSSAVSAASTTFGVDFLLDPDRGPAIKEAIDKNIPVSTEVTTLLGTPSGRKGFVAYLPVYMNNMPIGTLTQRRKAIYGLITTGFSGNDLFNTILAEQKIPFVTMAVYDTQIMHTLTDKNVLYDSHPGVSAMSNLTTSEQLFFGERNWTIKFIALKGYGIGGTEKLLPSTILYSGIIFSFLLSLSLYLLMSSRARAISLAEKITFVLKRSEEQYRAIFETLQDVYYRTDLDGKIIAVSPSIEHYIGIKPEALIGQNASLFYVDPIERDTMLKKLQQDGEVTDYPLSLKGKNSESIAISLTGHLIFDKDKKPIGLEGILRDVSERKKFEEELQQRTNELERFNKIMVDRELKMVVLKKEIEELKRSHT